MCRRPPGAASRENISDTQLFWATFQVLSFNGPIRQDGVAGAQGEPGKLSPKNPWFVSPGYNFRRFHFHWSRT
jgi:hypothetical protein